MEDPAGLEQTNHYPWVKFKLHGEHYCVSSRIVSSMGPVGDINPLPEREPWFLGLTNMGGRMIPAVDLRNLLHLPGLQTDLDAFAQMKEKHTQWVEELKRSVLENTAFELDRDPHKCSFGQWYDHYHSSNNVIDFILDEIKPPHEELHRCAQRIDEARASQDEESVRRILEQADALCAQKIIPLLDRLIEAYNEAHRGMVIVLSGQGKDKENKEEKWVGVVVDSVTGLEYLTENKGIGAVIPFGASEYIRDIYISDDHRIYLELDGEKLLGLTAQ